MTSHPHQFKSTTLEVSYRLVLVSCAALIVIYTIDSFFIGPGIDMSFWIIKVIPIAAIMPALFSRNLRSFQWLCFLIMIYFIQGVLDIFSPDKIVQGILETFFTLLSFSSAVFLVHGCQKQKKQVRNQE